MTVFICVCPKKQRERKSRRKKEISRENDLCLRVCVCVKIEKGCIMLLSNDKGRVMAFALIDSLCEYIYIYIYEG